MLALLSDVEEVSTFCLWEAAFLENCYAVNVNAYWGFQIH